jgi:hypothetical protein
MTQTNVVVTNYTGKILDVIIDAGNTLSFKIYPDKTIKKVVTVSLTHDALGVHARSQTTDVYSIDSKYLLSYYGKDIEIVFLLGRDTEVAVTPLGKLAVKDGKIFRAGRYRSRPGTRYLVSPLTDAQYATVMESGNGTDKGTDWDLWIFAALLVLGFIVILAAVVYGTYLEKYLFQR